jgi:anti-anti-sigma factor
MNPFERVHRLIASGKVIGPDGTWTSRTEALKEKRALLEHVLAGEVAINGRWTRLSDLSRRTPLPEPARTAPPPPTVPPGTRIKHEFEKETAIMPPPRYDYTPPPLPTEPVRQNYVETAPPGPILRNTPPPVPAPGPDIPQKGPGQPEMPFLELIERIANTPQPVVEESAPAHPELHPFRQEIPFTATPPAAPVTPPAPPETEDVAPPVFRELPREERVAAPQPVITSTPEPALAPQIPQPEPIVVAARAPEEIPPPAVKPVPVRKISLGKETSLAISEIPVDNTGVVICGVEGFIDQSNSDRFHQHLISMLESGIRFFIVDLEQTILVGSAGWGVMAVTARMVKMSGGRLFVCSMKAEIAESFHLLQFDAVIDSCQSRQDGIVAIGNIINNQPIAAPAAIGIPGTDSAVEAPVADLPLAEKIRTIISRSGPLSLLQIRAQLKQNEYGQVRIGPLKLYGVLRDLNLDKHWKRVRFYRSC